MSSYNAAFEIHVHGQVLLRADVTYEQLQDALRPLWAYAGARTLKELADRLGISITGMDERALQHYVNQTQKRRHALAR